MIETDMKEMAENQYTIDNIDYEVIEELIHFIYTEKH